MPTIYARTLGALLQDVRQFMSDQLFARRTARLIFATRKVNLLALRVGESADCRSPCVFMHANAGEVRAESSLHLSPQNLRQ